MVPRRADDFPVSRLAHLAAPTIVEALADYQRQFATIVREGGRTVGLLASRLGASDYIVKPFGAKELSRVLEKFCSVTA